MNYPRNHVETLKEEEEGRKAAQVLTSEDRKPPIDGEQGDASLPFHLVFLGFLLFASFLPIQSNIPGWLVGRSVLVLVVPAR